MKVRYALMVAGDRALNEFSWGDQLLLAIQLYFPKSDLPQNSQTGNEILRRIESLGAEVGQVMLDFDVVPAEHPSVVRQPDAVAPSPADGGIGKIKLTLPGLMTIGMAAILLSTAILLVTSLDFNNPEKSGEEKIELFTMFGKALKEVFSLVGQPEEK